MRGLLVRFALKFNPMKLVRIGVINIGDELLLGQVIDSNSARIGQFLAPLGLNVHRKWCVGDDAEEIKYALTEAARTEEIILITGGLGPTRDDVTKKVLAEYFGVGMVFSEENYAHLRNLLEPRNVPIREVHRQQCFMPANARLLENKMGTAMGMWMEHEGKIYIAMPGVPYEMDYIMIHGVLPGLKAKSYSSNMYHQTMHVGGMGETEIAAVIEPLLNKLPEYISLAYLPALGTVRVRLTGNHENAALLKQQIDDYLNQMSASLGEKVFGFGDSSLEKALGAMLLEKGLKLGTAESCTGGNIAHKITSVPGSSAYFMGGVISYTNAVKKTMLNVKDQTLENHGAVSEQTVREMVTGCCEALNVDLAIAVSGIAGPDGGTDELPVGTIFIAAGNADGILTRKLKLGKDRSRNIETASIYALLLAREWILSPK